MAPLNRASATSQKRKRYMPIARSGDSWPRDPEKGCLPIEFRNHRGCEQLLAMS